MSFSDHVEMLDSLHALKGMVVLSGYPNGLYDAALSARSAARSARSAARSAESAAYMLMADKLIALIEATP